MKKRGAAFSMLLASEVVAAAIILLLLFNHAMRWSSSERPYQTYLAKDMALVINLLYSSSGGNIIVNYTQNASEFNVNIDEEKVLLYKMGIDIDEISRKFIKTKISIINEKTFKKPKEIQFAKIGNEILIDNQIQADLDTLECSEFTVEKLTGKRILIDPGYEEGDTKPSLKICFIANSFISELTTAGFDYSKLYSTRKLDEYGEDERLASINCNDISKSDESYEADVVISIREGKDKDTTKNNIKAFIVSDSENEKESRKLACLIINSILENTALNGIKITGGSIVPVDLETTDKNFPDGIKDEIFVMLEIGNSDSDNGKELLEKTQEIGYSISKGFMEYGK